MRRGCGLCLGACGPWGAPILGVAAPALNFCAKGFVSW